MAHNPQSRGGDHERQHRAFLEAVNQGDSDRVRRFLADPAIDINYADPLTGLTALHIAAGRSAGAIVRLLAGTGRCDYTIKDGKGRTAARVAVIAGRNPALGRYLFDLQYKSGIAAARRSGRAAGSESDHGEA